MKVLLHKINKQKQTVIHLPVERDIKIKTHKKGFVILKVPYRATTQDRLLIDLEGKYVEAWLD